MRKLAETFGPYRGLLCWYLVAKGSKFHRRLAEFYIYDLMSWNLDLTPEFPTMILHRTQEEPDSLIVHVSSAFDPIDCLVPLPCGALRIPSRSQEVVEHPQIVAQFMCHVQGSDIVTPSVLVDAGPDVAQV